ncbi:MAG: hypothetical protein IJS71_09130, partial [Clostridia bacterium]|nr:hypothetical protein [Clostridia bacterium]
HMTMTDALEAAEAFGYDVGKINASAVGNEILWDSRNDLFCYLDEATIRYIPESVLIYTRDNEDVSKRIYDVDYWVIKADLHEKYSTYLYEYTGNGVIENLKTGLDVGNEAVSSVSYIGGTSAQTVTIRTTSGLLKINAPLETDTVNHYGKASSLVIEAIGTSSYHEFGQVEYAQIKTGHIVIETSDAYIHNLLLIANDTGDGFEPIILEIKDGAPFPVLDRTDVTIGANGTLVLTLKTGSTVEYIYLTNNGVIEEVYVSTEKIDTTTTNVVGHPSAQLASTKSESTFTAAQQIANDVNGGKDHPSLEAVAAGTTYFAGGLGTDSNPYLISTATHLSNVRNYLSASFKVINDIDMSQVTSWTPIGTSKTAPFSGKFNGSNFAIKNWNTTKSLFGYVKGTENTRLTGEIGALLDENYNLIESNVSEDNYTAIVKNVKIEDSNIVINASSNNGVIVEYTIDSYIDNCEVSKCTIIYESGWYTAIMIGGVHKSHIKNLHLANDNSITCSEEPGYLGNSGLVIGGIYNAWNTDSNYLYTQSSKTIINGCINDASVTLNKTYNAGFLGAVLGCIYSYMKNDLIINCVNNGNLTVNNLATCTSVSGICGAHMGGHGLVTIVGCSNNGNIVLTGNSSKSTDNAAYDQISGICSYGTGPYVNCSNAGSLIGDVEYIGGICASSADGNSVTFINCSNTGYLSSANENASIGETCANAAGGQNVDAATINTLSTNPYKITLQNAGSVTGTMNVPASVGKMIVDGEFGFSAINLSNKNGTIELDISNATFTLVGNNQNASFTVVGTNNTIVVDQNAVLKNIKLSGAGNRITNNGSISHLTIVNTSEESVNNGAVESVRFVAEDDTNMSFINNGTIGEHNNSWHTVSTQSKINLTFTNNGTIYGSGQQYALLFYGMSNVTFNAGAASSLVVENAQYTAVFFNGESMRANSVTFNVASGAAGASGGSYYGIATHQSGGLTPVTVHFN